MKILCKFFGHKWPYAMKALQIMGAIEAKNGFPCRTVVECRRGCGATRNLTEEAASVYAERKRDMPKNKMTSHNPNIDRR